ncbi:MAG: hypothetical protein GOMPHAMPRED_001255 [Gomphillus americanus]|uniref:Tetratricopeptide repeat and J domain-containing co-chaperone DNJ1 n=1 Tax=Gomphillus americanus TaxID=1940652 RepID=A0A8H3IE38_9LECA|nr:MAG: hypothetical protein GOMPHAMPRED_001255 [Gomphillus americanus]
MALRSKSLAFVGLLALSCQALSPRDIPSDTPVDSLIASAKGRLAIGEISDALLYYDAAVSKDPGNYINIFQRGATYLSLGKDALATKDFDKVLEIKPDFEGALVQRAKLKSRNADWQAARADYKKAHKESSEEYTELVAAEKAAAAAVSAEKRKDWETCITEASPAILVAGTDLLLRQLRARCRFERGEVQEGVSDLQHVLQLAPGSLEPHLQISSELFYSIGDTERGLTAIRKCLHSDPDSKTCRKLLRQEKNLDKKLKKFKSYQDKKQYSNAVKILVGDGDETGVLAEVKEEVEQARKDGSIHAKSPNELYNRLVEETCNCYVEMNNKKRAATYCEENLKLNPNSLPALLFKARQQLDADEFEPCIHTLNHANEHHPGAQQIQTLMQKAQVALKRSKTKDYYKVLQIDREADERTIKKNYRRLVKEFHPDKALAKGISKEEAEKKIQAINEAYEVLNDPEKKAQFDRGEDPNDPSQQGAPFQGSPFGSGQHFFHSSGGGQRFQFQAGGGMPFNFPGGGMPFNFG